jgi:DNA-binding LacI/PurR family transcriptional regulator
MNLREFSKKIGLPISTISKALGGYKDVNDNTRSKIVSLAKKYKYVPNVYAKTLASRNTFICWLSITTWIQFYSKKCSN